MESPQENSMLQPGRVAKALYIAERHLRLAGQLAIHGASEFFAFTEMQTGGSECDCVI
jgi:hypothetical protein